MTNEEATQKLAEAMSKLATALEKFQDPMLWQRVISDAMRVGFLPPRAFPTPLVQGELPGGRVEAMQLSLTDEERVRLAQQVYQTLQPRLAEFNTFVKNALKEMPAARLKDLAEKIERGVVPSLSRRGGCVFVSVDGEDFYLGL